MTTTRSFALSNCVLLISLMQSVNGIQFLIITCLSFLPDCLGPAAAPTPTTVMVPLTSIYASL